MFFPWWEHDEYEIKTTHLKYGDLDDEERALLADYPKLTMAKLAWRRRIATEATPTPRSFKEEYPMSQEEAFLSTGYNACSP